MNVKFCGWKKRRRFFYGNKSKKLRMLWNGLEKSAGKWCKEKSEGFTYVETIAVIAICAILTAGSVFSASKIIAAARKTAAKSQIEQYGSALQTYFLDCGRFPTTEQGLHALWEKPVFYPIPADWNGPYLEREPCTDPWGTDFTYLSSESSVMPAEVPAGLPYVLISYGADGKEGGKGDASDICSWK